MTTHTVVGLQEHTCNAWCTHPLHIHVVLVTPEASADDLVHGGVAKAYYQLHRRLILDARLATEIDQDAVVAAKEHHHGISTQLTVTKFSREDLAQLTCWRITFRQE